MSKKTLTSVLLVFILTLIFTLGPLNTAGLVQSNSGAAASLRATGVLEMNGDTLTYISNVTLTSVEVRALATLSADYNTIQIIIK